MGWLDEEGEYLDNKLFGEKSNKKVKIYSGKKCYGTFSSMELAKEWVKSHNVPNDIKFVEVK